jgi:hypothetical protein
VTDFVSGNTSKLSNSDGGMLRDVAAVATTTVSLLLLLLLLTPLFDPPASSFSAVDFMSSRSSRSESITSLFSSRFAVIVDARERKSTILGHVHIGAWTLYDAARHNLA